MKSFTSLREPRNHQRVLGPYPTRSHIRTLRGGEIAADPLAVKAFVLNGREIRPRRDPAWGARPVMVNTDRIGSTAWELEDGSTLCISCFDLIEALVEVSALGYDVVGYPATS